MLSSTGDEHGDVVYSGFKFGCSVVYTLFSTDNNADGLVKIASLSEK